jgi:hypothetical protein
MSDASRWAPLAALLLVPAVGAAQDTPRPERLYINPMEMNPGPRALGLGGAFVGVAERAEGISSNLASLAQRNPLLYGSVDVEGTASWLASMGDNGPKSTEQFSASFMLQIRRFGIGAYYRRNTQALCVAVYPLKPCDDTLTVLVESKGFASAMSFLDDDLILGFGVMKPAAGLTYRYADSLSGDSEEWSYGRDPLIFQGYQLEGSLLYRPNGQPFRVGVRFQPETVGGFERKYNQARGDLQAVTVVSATHQVPSAVVTPGLVSVGASIRLGEGMRNYNRLSPKAREVMLERVGPAKTPAEVPYDAPSGSFLVTMQLDLLLATKGAIASSLYVTAPEPSPPPLAGEATLMVARLGVEHETLPGRLRLRAGTWFEPSLFAGLPQRGHGTGGADLRLFHFIIDWTVYAAVDLAAGSYLYTFGLTGWQGPTPFRKPKQVQEAEAEKSREPPLREEAIPDAPLRE